MAVLRAGSRRAGRGVFGCPLPGHLPPQGDSFTQPLQTSWPEGNVVDVVVVVDIDEVFVVVDVVVDD